jgi:hypothetical protein
MAVIRVHNDTEKKFQIINKNCAYWPIDATSHLSKSHLYLVISTRVSFLIETYSKIVASETAGSCFLQMLPKYGSMSNTITCLISINCMCRSLNS